MTGSTAIRNTLINKVLTLAVMAAAFVFVLCIPAASVKAASISPENHTIVMSYDDYLDLGHMGEAGTISDQNVTSKQVKVTHDNTSGSFQNTLTDNDRAVIEWTGQTLHAVGVGQARVEIGSESYQVTVGPASISLFLILGQSNAEGLDGDPSKSIACENGTVYSTVDNSYWENLTYSRVASSLAGANSTVALDGSRETLSLHPISLQTESGSGKQGIDSGLAYEWHKEYPEEKVWVVNAAVGGTTIDKWLPDQECFNGAVRIFRSAQAVLDAEICAGHYTLSHMGYFWLQGEGDYACPAGGYVNSFKMMHEGLKSRLKYTFGKQERTLEFGNILLVRAADENAALAGIYGYRKDLYGGSADTEQYNPGITFRDLEMTGPRVAQYYMANSTDDSFKDVNLVCDIGDKWVYDINGKADGVGEYFRYAYPGGSLDYPVQYGSLSMPVRPEDLHYSIHYTQTGYNELGREAARNTIKILEDTTTEPSVEFATWKGFESVKDGETVEVGTIVGPDSLLVPRVTPLYMSKKVSLRISPEVCSSYYDHFLYNDPETGLAPGMLTAVYNGSPIVTIHLKDHLTPVMMTAAEAENHIRKGDTLYFGYASRLPETSAAPQTSSPIRWNVLDVHKANGGLNTTDTPGLWLWTSHSWGSMGLDRLCWQGSSGQTWCSGFFENNLSKAEQDAVLGIKTTGDLDSIDGTKRGSTDKMYPLSIDEANTTGMGSLLNGSDYWFRSFYSENGINGAFYWDYASEVTNSNIRLASLPYYPDSSQYGLIEGRPATNLDYRRILFISQADESSGRGKAAGDPGIRSMIQSSNGRNWKLTLSCDDLNGLSIDDTTVRISKEGKLTAGFTYISNGGDIRADRLSLVVTDRDNSVIYYGKVADLGPQSSQTGSFSIENYTGLIKEGRVAIFPERKCGSFQTDYAGNIINLVYDPIRYAEPEPSCEPKQEPSPEPKQEPSQTEAKKITPYVRLSSSSYTYDGKVKTPSVTVKDGTAVLKNGEDYTLYYDSGRKTAGTYKVSVELRGKYSGSATKTFTINKAANPLKIKAKTATVKYSKLKKKKQTLSISKAISFTKKGQGAMTYKKVSGNKKITINKKTGKITIAKGLGTGTYKLKVKIKAGGNTNYKASTVKTAVITLKVK